MAGYSEKQLERKLVAYAKSIGVLSYKFSSPSTRGVPDRIFIGPNGVLFMELKVGTNKPTDIQQHHIALINSHGGIACWVNDFETGKNKIEELR